MWTKKNFYCLDAELTLQSLFWEDFSSLQDVSDLSTKGNCRGCSYEKFWDSLESFCTFFSQLHFRTLWKQKTLKFSYNFYGVRICNSGDKSLAIRQKAESQNGCYKKTKHTKFSEKRTFVTSLIHVSGGNKCSFFRKFGVSCFLVTRFEICPSALCRRSRLRPPSINYSCLYVSIRTNPFILQPHCSDALKDTKKLWQLWFS